MSRQHRRLPSLLLASGIAVCSLALGACEEEGGPMAVYDIQPRVGGTAGEQPIRIAGANFRQDVGYAVYFGSFRATAVTILDTSTLLVVTPQHEPGPVDVVVASEAGPAFRVQQAFTFNAETGRTTPQPGQPGAGPERY